MHPVNRLFEEIYRNYWGISPASDRPERRRAAEPATRGRELLVRPERRQD
jgi:hypothetical protein